MCCSWCPSQLVTFKENKLLVLHNSRFANYKKPYYFWEGVAKSYKMWKQFCKVYVLQLWPGWGEYFISEQMTISKIQLVVYYQCCVLIG